MDDLWTKTLRLISQSPRATLVRHHSLTSFCISLNRKGLITTFWVQMSFTHVNFYGLEENVLFVRFPCVGEAGNREGGGGIANNTINGSLIDTLVAKLKKLMLKEKKEEILTQSYDKNPYTHRTIQKATWQHKNATKNFDYTTIADRLSTSIKIVRLKDKSRNRWWTLC